MPIWITAMGIGSIGTVYGYVLFYVLKRYLPPVIPEPPSFKELLLSVTSLGMGSAIGASLVSLDGMNYIGPYGIGMLIGATINTIITLHHQHILQQLWYSQNVADPMSTELLEQQAKQPQPLLAPKP